MHTATWSTAIKATTHCLIGCGIGEIVGMVVGTAFGWHNAATTILAIALAFLFGFSLTFWSIMRSGTVPLRQAIRITIAADALSITVMEIVDNTVIWMIPGAVHTHLTDSLFWFSLMVSLIVAFIVTVPINYLLIKRGAGHALVHSHHAHTKHQTHEVADQSHHEDAHRHHH